MKLLRLLAILILFTASEASAAQFGGVEEFSVNLSPQYFQWEEFFNGRRLLREQGWLVGAGPLIYLNLLQAEPAGSLLLKGKAEVFGGVVGYTGETQPPNPFPVKTDVGYVGVKGEVDLGWRFTVNKVSFEPFGGVGYRWWLRDLYNSTTVDNSGKLVKVNGYTETWQSVYARAGGQIGYAISDDWRAFCEGGAKYPFYTGNSVDFTETGNLTTKPGGRWSAFAEIGARYRKFKLSAFYEGFRYAQSPVVASSTLRVFQPTSESDLFGFSLGWVFR
ncbi:hypothetical protein [Geotalea uraniireducens]|uniref:Outer membrane protein beta-barrel domain-containing protein n=1 Tax=Geotalea uraniireducens (strain Rf4) TaxID=351605 RepID=A5GAD2_GEOUR|nr:hypothetical protein [Geotalea uraniireducens]ABQ25461.1 hypothetical protein Gura_1257 [Geotalea uraniireducens Rf4]